MRIELTLEDKNITISAEADGTRPTVLVDGEPVKLAVIDNPKTDETPRLLATAPDLLGACRYVLRYLDGYQALHPNAHGLDAAVAVLRHALAAAEGTGAEHEK